MPLIKDLSREAFKHNIKAEMDAGKTYREAVAIAFSIRQAIVSEAAARQANTKAIEKAEERVFRARKAAMVREAKKQEKQFHESIKGKVYDQAVETSNNIKNKTTGSYGNFKGRVRNSGYGQSFLKIASVINNLKSKIKRK